MSISKALGLAGLVLLIVAFLTKLDTAMGYTRREAAGLGVLMNTRGITGIIVLGAGLNSGIITSPGYTVLVVMVLTTTVVTTPLLKLLRLGRWDLT